MIINISTYFIYAIYYVWSRTFQRAYIDSVHGQPEHNGLCPAFSITDPGTCSSAPVGQENL